MSGVFADAFYYIGLMNPADQYHEAALRVGRSAPQPLVTTAWVLVEVADALSSPGHRRLVHRFLEQAPENGRTRVVAGAEWYTRGLALYGARPDKAWSLTDCISFGVMAEFGLTEALTGDRHFEQAGFRALLRTP